MRWTYTDEPLRYEKLGNFDHLLVVYSEGHSVFGLIQFFGVLVHVFCLSQVYQGHEFFHAYQVNPLRDSEPAESRIPEIEKDSLPIFDRCYARPIPECRPVYQNMISKFLAKYYDLAYEAEVNRIIDDVLSKIGSETNKEKIQEELIHRISEFICSRRSRVVKNG